MSCPRNKHNFRCDQNGPPARREEGAYLNGYVTDEQRSRRPIFIATLWAAVSWLFFRVARSSRIDLDMLVARALKNSQLTCGERHAYFGNRTLACITHKFLEGAPSLGAVESDVDSGTSRRPTNFELRPRVESTTMLADLLFSSRTSGNPFCRNLTLWPDDQIS